MASLKVSELGVDVFILPSTSNCLQTYDNGGKEHILNGESTAKRQDLVRF